MSDRPRVEAAARDLELPIAEARRVLRDRRHTNPDEIRAALEALVGPAEQAATWLRATAAGDVDV